jgi:two-component sensor histidine kinase
MVDKNIRSAVAPVLFWTVIFGVFYYLSLHNYLFFHFSAELFSVIIASVIFIIIWNTRHHLKNNFFLVVGQAYLFVAVIDFFHTLAYKGVDIIATNANLATEFWISARYFESLALLAGAYLVSKNKTLNTKYIFPLLSLIFAVLMITIYPLDIFPRCFHPETGLTLFKIVSEYLICFILLVALYFLVRARKKFSTTVFYFTVISICLTVVAELMFTLYISVYGLANVLGHFFKVLSFYFIYQGIVMSGFRAPLENLLKELLEKERKLETTLQEKETLLKEIHHRVKNNLNVIASMLSLQANETEDEEARSVLQDSSERINSISLLHKNFYQSGDVGKVDFSEYITKLVNQLVSALNAQAGKVNLKLELEPVRKLSLKREIYLGLLVTELVTNALKYAGEPGDGELELEISFNSTPDGYRLKVADNGGGLKKDFESLKEDSLGLRLVTILTEEQLNGELSVDSSSQGTTFEINLPEETNAR